MPIVVAIGVILAIAGAVLLFAKDAKRELANEAAGNGANPTGDPMFSVAVFQTIQYGPRGRPMGSPYFRTSRRGFLLSQIRHAFPRGVSVEGGRVIVKDMSRGVEYIGHPIVRDGRWEVASGASNAASIIIGVVVAAGVVVATVYGGPPAGAVVAAGGAALAGT